MAAGRRLPRWGTRGERARAVGETRGPLSFVYRPHLFPGLDEALRLGHLVQYRQLPGELPADSPVEVATVLESYCHLSGDLFGWQLGAPKPLDETPVLGFPTYDSARMLTLGMTVKF